MRERDVYFTDSSFAWPICETFAHRGGPQSEQMIAQ